MTQVGDDYTVFGVGQRGCYDGYVPIRNEPNA